MSDISFMPQCHVFHGGEGIAANYPGQSRHPFAGDRVAFVRHGRGAFLPGVKELFDFTDIGALEVADFGGKLVE